VQSYSQVAQTEAQKISDKFLNLLIKNDGKGMYEMFSPEVKEKLTLDQTSLVWGQITGMFGELVNKGEIETNEYNGSVLCRCLLSFKNGNIEAKLSVNKDGLISGFFISPKQDEKKYDMPAYADTTKFVETLVKFGEEKFILNGIVSLPKSTSKTPVVILVHGSGPHDMDESVGPNRPFKDLAWGLASNGIAVLRYNKRTKQYPDKMIEILDSADVYDEVIDDAVNAVNMLSDNGNIYNIDTNQIYVLGHSLGGTLLPRITRETKKIAGVISMAGMTRKLENVLVDQYNYLYSLDGEISKDEQVKIDELKRQIANMLSDKLSRATPSDSLPLNMPAQYWMTFKTIDPASEIKDFKNRILILQGLRDYQVTLEDYELWQKSLKGNKKADFKLYDDLNHLMQKGVGRSKPDEYYLPSAVDQKVIKDISEWIKKK
jgi:dienelactone hydrolase